MSSEKRHSKKSAVWDERLEEVCPQYESNIHRSLRTGPFYPLNYGGEDGKEIEKVDRRRFELLTPSMPWKCSTN